MIPYLQICLQWVEDIIFGKKLYLFKGWEVLMTLNDFPQSKHFSLESLAPGVYACIHKPGGAAYSNAGVINLGDRTILVDAFNSLAAGGDLRLAAETLFQHPVDMSLLTHPHNDHWIGASAFDKNTSLVSTPSVRKVALEWGENMMQEYEEPSEWQDWLGELEAKHAAEEDPREKPALAQSIVMARTVLQEMEVYQPRYPDIVFDDSLTWYGSQKTVEFRSMGRGHSEEDVALLLPEDSIAFIGDIGFFACQPFLGFCDIDGYRRQVQFFLDSEYEIFIPGHGPLGSKDDLALQMGYFDMLEGQVGEVIDQGGSVENALNIQFPEPYREWLYGSRGRFEANVKYIYNLLIP